MFEEAGVAHGQTVLVHGATGSVGLFILQLARWAGVRVIATARSRNLGELCRFGADQVIETDTTRFDR